MGDENTNNEPGIGDLMQQADQHQAERAEPQEINNTVQQADQQGGERGEINNDVIENRAVDEGAVVVPITTGLEEYLKKTADGKRVFKKYNEYAAKQKPLPKKTKSLLVREVIRREKNYLLKNITADEVLNKLEIKSERFQLLAQEICSIFKYEYVGRYYTPSHTENKEVTPASGKLLYHFDYVKKVLRQENILKRRNSSETVQDISNVEIDLVNENNDLEWLTNHLEPWDEVTIKWERSHDTRRVLLVGKNLSVCEYIDKFPCLKNQKAKELFSIDFNLLNPDKTLITGDRWNKVKAHLISCLSEVTIETAEDRTLLGLVKTTVLNSEKEDFLVLYLLCHLVKPKRSGKRKRCQNAVPPKRLSLQERRETFILRVETANDITPKLLDLTDRYMQDHSTFQPAVVAVGPASNVSNYYVVVNEKLFAANNILEAVELSLKIFFSLDCKYPENSHVIWTFLQKVLFNIDLRCDSLSLEVTELVEYIRKL